MANLHAYDDILYAPRHISKRHTPMSPQARAVIFAPYAALTGFEGQILSAQHHRCDRILLTEEELEKINFVLSTIRKHDTVSVTYFHYNPGSDGRGGFAEGEYLELTGKVLEITPAFRTLRISQEEDWRDLAFEDILGITKMRQSFLQ